MQIQFRDDRFVAVCTFDERLIFKDAGWSFDRSSKQWVTTDAAKAYPFESLADDIAFNALQKAKGSSLVDLMASYATDAAIDIPAPPGLFYDPHQKAAIRYASTRSNTLCADQPGLGKTMVAVGLSNYKPEIRQVLIVCPAHLTVNWKREWQKWDVKGLSVGTVRGPAISERTGKPLKSKTVKEYPNTDVVICQYNLVPEFSEAIRSFTWDLVIFDESHYMCNPSAIRTRFALGAPKQRKKIIVDGKKKFLTLPGIDPIVTTTRLFLTGTPILSKPVELWPTIKALDADDLGSDWFKFVMRYCNGFYMKMGKKKILDSTGNSNLQELQVKLRSKFMIRRDKTTVMADLPPKRRQLLELPREGLDKMVDEEIAAMEAIRDAMDDFLGDRKIKLKEASKDYWDKFVDTLQAKFGNWADPDYILQFRHLSPPMQIAFEKLSASRKSLALAKVPMIISHLKTYVDASEKVVCFVRHTALAEALKEAFANCCFITGKVASDRRQEVVDRFQNDPTANPMIANMTAAGTGYTMTAAYIAVFAELDWVPSLIEQCEDRLWRRGQKNAVLCQHLVVEGSLDAHMVEVLMEKQQIANQILNASEMPNVEETKELLASSSHGW